MILKRRTLFLALGLLGLPREIHAIEQVNSKADWLEKAGVGFSMMYYLGEVQSEAEVRLVDEIDGISGQRTGRKDPRGFRGILTPEGIDVAALVAR
jgi:hypothetical protein